MKSKKGISLIVLIITIVVIIILAAAIILSLEDDPADSADRAVAASDLAALKEAVGIANAQYNLSDKSMTKDKYIYEYLDRNEIPYTGYHIENGKLVEGDKK